MLKTVHIRNFKSLLDTPVELGMLNVLVGNNGAGKSSFFRALNLLRNLAANDSVNSALAEQRTEFNDLVSLKAGTKAIKFDVRVQLPAKEDRPALDANVQLEIRKRRFCYVASEHVLPWEHRSAKASDLSLDKLPYAMLRTAPRRMIAAEGEKSMTFDGQVLSHSFLRDVLHQSEFVASSRMIQRAYPLLSAVAISLVRFCHFEIWGPELLRQPSPRNFGMRLAHDGRNIAAVLAEMRRRSPENFRAIVEDMRSAYEWLEEIEVREIEKQTFGISFIERTSLGKKPSKTRKRYLPSQVSDGLLRVLALCTIRHGARFYSTIAFEEPENGLHPSMIEKSASLLRAISNEGTQVIVSTHSPMFVNAIFANASAEKIATELRLVRRDTNGATTILAPDSKTIDDALHQGVSIGDLWSMLLSEAPLAQMP